MEFEPLRYWFQYDSLDFDTLFFWARILAIIALATWLIRRHRQRKKQSEEQKVAAVLGKETIPEEASVGVSDLVGKIVGSLRGAPDETPKEKPKVRRDVPAPPESDPDQLLLDKLPSPRPGRCHLVFLNEDATWVDITVRGQDRTLAMVGQKMLSLTLEPTVQVISISPRNGSKSSRISVAAKGSYCLIELEMGQITQCCSEKGPIDYDKFTA